MLAAHQPQLIISLLNFTQRDNNSEQVEGNIYNAWQTSAPVLRPIVCTTTRQTWQQNPQGLSVQDATLSVILPEQDGVITESILGFKENLARDTALEIELKDFKLAREALPPFIAKIKSYLVLQTMENKNKRLAVMTSNYPAKDSRLMNGVGLNTPESLAVFFKKLHQKKYDLGKKYQTNLSGQDIANHMAAGITNEYATQKKNNNPKKLSGKLSSTNRGAQKKIRLTLSLADYKNYFANMSNAWQKKITQRWGAPSQDPFFDKDKKSFLIMGEQFGNILLLLQPQRGYDIDADESQHDPHLPPPHYYIAHHAYLEKFAPHAFIHFGKHGNLEWLSGKSLGALPGVGSSCLPRALLPTCPYFYPFIINDPGEGAQAKRRTAATIIAHLPPMMMRAEQSTSLQKLEWLMDEYQQARQLNEGRQQNLIRDIWQELTNTELDKELGIEKNAWSVNNLQQLAVIDKHLCALRDLQIRGGLHVLGGGIDGAQLAENIFYLMRLKTHVASLPQTLSDLLDLQNNATHKNIIENCFGKNIITAGDEHSAIQQLSIAWLGSILSLPRNKKIEKQLQPIFAELKKSTMMQPLIEHVHNLHKKIILSPQQELDNLLRGLDGQFIPPGGSGAPSRGRPDLLPTGHNFFTVDNRKTPSAAAFDIARRSGHLVLSRYLSEHGDYPKNITLTAWGTAEMRTAGETIAMALWLMGCEPTWEETSGRVVGFNIMPLSLLQRPRVMITLRISGFFRDAFPHLIDLFDSAYRAVAQLNETAEQNPIADHYKKTSEELIQQGADKTTAEDFAGAAIFGPAPNSYGTGMQQMLDNGSWQSKDDLAQQFLYWTSHYYTKDQANKSVTDSQSKKNIFHNKLSTTDVVMQNQDNREHDILDSDDYYQFQGGLFNAASFLQQKNNRDKKIAHYHNDHSNPAQPVVRTLAEEIGLIVRGRAVNKKWLARIRQQGYKGGFEMAATVDYLFAFAATTVAVTPAHFDLLFQHYLLEEDSVKFLRDHNLPALYDMAAKFQEAIDRKLWQPRQNHVMDILQKLLVEKKQQID